MLFILLKVMNSKKNSQKTIFYSVNNIVRNVNYYSEIWNTQFILPVPITSTTSCNIVTVDTKQGKSIEIFVKIASVENKNSGLAWREKSCIFDRTNR